MLIPTIQTDSLNQIQLYINSLFHLQTEGITVPNHFQIDCVDGLFASDITVMPHELGSLDWHGFSFESHLLTVDPEEYIGAAYESGARSIIAQIERLHDRVDFLEVVHQLKLKAGLALDIYTPISELSDFDLNTADIVLLMAAPAGFSGQELKPQIFSKINELRARGFSKSIEIDGGVNSSNIADLKQAGADMFAVNSALWHDRTVKENLKQLMFSLSTNH